MSIDNNLISKIRTTIEKRDRARYRDRRAHYASSSQNCLRDQYWGLTKEPITNPPDFISRIRMMMGDAVEWGIREYALKHMHFLGEHFVADQVTVGGSDPAWNGYEDALMAKRTNTADGGEEWEKYVIEIKAKFGFGADFLMGMSKGHSPVPQDGHVLQLGLYLKDMVEKGVCDSGWLVYVCMSDRTLGSMVGFQCTYEAPFVRVTGCQMLDVRGGGEPRLSNRACNLEFNIDTMVLERWKRLDQHVADGTVPEKEYQYKYSITNELLQEKDESDRYKISDAKLLKVIDGSIVLGDWQVKYSDYKDKQLEVDGLSGVHSEEEKVKCRIEYKRRHPSSKKF